jgi:CheY-like chemotaxis protein
VVKKPHCLQIAISSNDSIGNVKSDLAPLWQKRHILRDENISSIFSPNGVTFGFTGSYRLTPIVACHLLLFTICVNGDTDGFCHASGAVMTSFINIERTAMENNILVIEPDPSERRKLRNLFSKDYALTFAHSCRKALQVLQGGMFPVAIVDLGKAHEPLITELSLLKSNQLYCPLIIAITSRNNFDVERAIAEIGVFYHLLTPVEDRDLQNLVYAAIRASGRIYSFISTEGLDHA